MNTPDPVVHNVPASRFEALLDGQLAVCDYRLRDGVVHFTHTQVPRHLRGHGHAAQLVHAALDWARREGHGVRPLCSYVAGYMRKHPETLDLLAR